MAVPVHTSPTPPRPAVIDPAALMRIRSLELRARVVVEGFRSGLHRSPYHGFSAEFTEYRPYVAGDDPRYVDWRVLARSDRVYIKKYEDETNLRCHLIVDRSHSMEFGSLGYSKADYAATLAATLAHFLQRQGDAVGLVVFDEQFREFLPARVRAVHLRQIMVALERPAGGRSTSLVSPLEQVARLVRRRGLLVMISDFLAPLEKLESNLLVLAAAGHETAVFQVADPAELSLGFRGSSVFEDMETARTVYVDPETSRRGYQERFERHGATVRALCERHGIAYARLVTDQPLERALLEFLQMRQRRRVRRVGGAGPGAAR